MARAMVWSARITTISLEMVLPLVIGLWIDRQLGTVLVFLVLGGILGMTTGMIHLVRLASPPKRDPPVERPTSDDRSD